MTIGGAEHLRVSPYQGLTPFDERDAEYFFGRERESLLICADLFAARLSLLYGASGVGKSSVLRAGVLPLLHRREDVTALVFGEWQSAPLERLKRAVLNALPSCKVNLHQPLAAFLRECAKEASRRLMIVLDQFEEYSLYHPTNDEPFAQQFPDATALPDLSVSFLVSLREEAVARLDRFEGRIPTLFDNLRRIDHLAEDAARSAIVKPLQKFTRGTIRAEQALVNAVVTQVRTGSVHVGEAGRGTTGETGGRIEAPYLQLVMTRIWNEERAEGSKVLRQTTLSRLGGAPKIVQTHLDAVMDKFTDEERDIATRVFQQLVTPSGAKIAHSVRDLADYAAVDASQLRSVLDSLSRGSDRILRPVAELPDRPGDPRYEIFHDRIAPAILDWRSRQVTARQTGDTQMLEDAERLTQSELLRTMVASVLNGLSDANQRAAQQMLTQFVTPAGSRALVAKDAFFGIYDAGVVVDILKKTAILIEGVENGKAFLSLAHDTLIPPILAWLGIYRRSEPALPKQSSEPPYQVIANLLRSRRVVLVLGSGASASNRVSIGAWTPASSFLPTGLELQRFLGNRVKFPSDELEQASFAEIAAHFAAATSRRDLDVLFDGIFKRRYEPPNVHRLLAEVARQTPLTILTTTFDSLIETELERSGARYSLAYSKLDRIHPVVWRGTPITADDFNPPSDETVIYKLFGSPPSYVLTEDDDMELFSQIAEGRLPPLAIGEKLRKSHTLFIGMGLSSWPQRLILRQLRDHTFIREWTRGWSIVGALGTADRYRWRAAGVEAYQVDIDEFAARLARALNITLDIQAE